MVVNLFGGVKTQKEAEKTVRRSWVPKVDYEVFSTCKRVSKYSIQYVDNLRWIAVEDFISKLDLYDELLNKRYSTGTAKQYTVRTPKDIHRAANKAANDVLRNLSLVDKTNLNINCARLGFKICNLMRYLPTYNDLIINSVDRMVDNLPDMPLMPNLKYDLHFWQDLKAELEQLKTEKPPKDDQLIDQVNLSNQLREELRIVLRSVIHLIYANYPDNVDEMILKSGFEPRN